MDSRQSLVKKCHVINILWIAKDATQKFVNEYMLPNNLDLCGPSYDLCSTKQVPQWKPLSCYFEESVGNVQMIKRPRIDSKFGIVNVTHAPPHLWALLMSYLRIYIVDCDY